MSTIIEDWDESVMDVEDYRAERALQNATLDAIRRARQCGTSYVIWEAGEMRSLRPHETGSYESRGLQNLERINREIARLQGLPAEACALNDKPAR